MKKKNHNFNVEANYHYQWYGKIISLLYFKFNVHQLKKPNFFFINHRNYITRLVIVARKLQ